MGLLFLLSLGVVLFYGAASVGTAWFLTHPPRRSLAWALAKAQPADPSQLARSRAFSEWTLVSRGLELRVWDIAGDDASGPVVVLTHGWGDGRVGALSRVPIAVKHASRVIAWDMAGHGDSQGVSTLGIREVDDMIALLDRLPACPVVLWGWSLGAGVSIAAAARPEQVKVIGVVSESGYRHARTPAANVLQARAMPWRVNLRVALWAMGTWLGVGPRWRGFDRVALAMKLRGRVPVLAVHGAQDIVSPIDDGVAMCDAAGGELCTIAGGGHNDLWSDEHFRLACEARISAFLLSLSRRGDAAPMRS